jgi:hypothetical protein
MEVDRTAGHISQQAAIPVSVKLAETYFGVERESCVIIRDDLEICAASPVSDPPVQ